MYDRYTISADKKTLEQAFKVSIPKGFEPCYNAAPTKALPVITSNHPEEAQLFQWGFISNLSNNKSVSQKLFNLPVANAFERPTYRRSLENNRCVILADGFFAWKQVSKKQRVPNYFYFKNRAPFGIAGIWEESEDIEGNISQSFNMLTVRAGSTLESYQEDMPMILDESSMKIWLDEKQEIDKLKSLPDKVSSSSLLTHPVSPLISDPEKDSEDLIKPSTPSDQFGNYTLFN